MSCNVLGNEMQIILNINFFTPLAIADNSYCAVSPTGHEYRDKPDQGQTHLYKIFLFASTISWPIKTELFSFISRKRVASRT